MKATSQIETQKIVKKVTIELTAEEAVALAVFTGGARNSDYVRIVESRENGKLFYALCKEAGVNPFALKEHSYTGPNILLSFFKAIRSSFVEEKDKVGEDYNKLFEDEPSNYVNDVVNARHEDLRLQE